MLYALTKGILGHIIPLFHRSIDANQQWVGKFILETCGAVIIRQGRRSSEAYSVFFLLKFSFHVVDTKSYAQQQEILPSHFSLSTYGYFLGYPTQTESSFRLLYWFQKLFC